MSKKPSKRRTSNISTFSVHGEDERKKLILEEKDEELNDFGSDLELTDGQPEMETGLLLPRVKEAYQKTYKNAVRLVLDKSTKSIHMVTMKSVVENMRCEFGETSAGYKTIEGVCRGHDKYTWIITYKSLPVEIVDKFITIHGSKVMLEDAGISEADYMTNNIFFRVHI